MNMHLTSTGDILPIHLKCPSLENKATEVHVQTALEVRTY